MPIGRHDRGQLRPATGLAAALLALGALAAATSRGQDDSGGASLEADLAAIADFNRRYVQAINDGDIETLAELTTDDHIMLTPNRPPLAGKDALVAAMTRAFERTEIDETWTPIETVVDGDLAYQRGTYTVAARPKGSDAEMRTTSGAFLRIYRRQPNGEWRMTRDMFNTYAAPEENRGAPEGAPAQD